MERYIGFAIKSGACILGVDKILDYKKSQYLILIDSEISQNSLKKIQNFATLKNIKTLTINNLSCRVNKDNVKCLSITNLSLANQIIKTNTQKGESEVV